MATTSPLRQRMIEDMMIRNLSRATQQSYIYAVARFSRHFNSSPDRLGMEEVRAYQLHLVAKNHSWSHINQVACAGADASRRRNLFRDLREKPIYILKKAADSYYLAVLETNITYLQKIIRRASCIIP